jgi:hypothetical protein
MNIIIRDLKGKVIFEGNKKDLSRAKLNEANLSWANLSEADLSRTDLSGAKLSWANLSGADLSRTDLSWANLSEADLSRTDLSGANLSRADLSWANLSEADLSGADLSGAKLSWANLSGANLSRAKGLLDPIEYIENSFKKTLEGYIIEKSFNEEYPSNSTWKIVPGEILSEVVNFDRTILCACGINGGTEKWCNKNCKKERWLLLLRFEWLAGVCVPYNTDGKIRMSRVEILGKKGEVNIDK